MDRARQRRPATPWCWTIAADLAEAALTLASAANAHTDLSARARLVTEAERVLRGVDWRQFSGHSG